MSQTSLTQPPGPDSDPNPNAASEAVPTSATGPDRTLWLIPLAIFGLALALRLWYAAQLAFPPLDDPAYYIQGARSLRAGRFLDLSILWNYFPRPENVLHPGFDFWMPLTSFLIAGSFALFGDSLTAAQLPPVTGGALLAVLTYYLTRQVLQHPALGLTAGVRTGLAGLAGLYVAVNPLLAYQSAVPDSQMIYAPLITAALLVWSSPRQNRSRAFLFGLLMGLAYLSRSHAVFLGLAWAGLTLARYLQRPAERPEIALRAGATLAGTGLMAGPWALRNWWTFGSIASPAGPQSALIDQYPTLFNYETPINLNSFMALGPVRITGARLEALFNAWVQVLGVMFFPTVGFAALGLFLVWRRNRAVGPAVWYCLLLGLGLPLIFVAASSTGSFYHSAGSMAAPGALGLVYLLWLVDRRYRRQRPGRLTIFPVLIGVILLLELVQLVVTVEATTAVHRQDAALYGRIGQWLAAHPGGEAVIADEPSTLNYATGRPAIRLPADEPLEVVQRLAQNYRARYILVTKPFGRYPALLQSPANTIFRLAYRDPAGEFEIYETG